MTGIQGSDAAADVQVLLSAQEGVDLDRVIRMTLGDESVLRQLVGGLESKNNNYRYHSFQVLLRISQDEPSRLHGEWDYLVALLDSGNAYHRSISVNILANLTVTPVGQEDRFTRVFDRYFDLLHDPSVMVARYVAGNAGTVARSRPDLRPRVTGRLLDIDSSHHQPGRRDLIKADVIQSFGEYFQESEDKERIRAFVEDQLGCSSPKTRVEAKSFLRRYGN
jgi:hypothetical protein